MTGSCRRAGRAGAVAIAELGHKRRLHYLARMSAPHPIALLVDPFAGSHLTHGGGWCTALEVQSTLSLYRQPGAKP